MMMAVGMMVGMITMVMMMGVVTDRIKASFQKSQTGRVSASKRGKEMVGENGPELPPTHTGSMEMPGNQPRVQKPFPH